MDNINKDNLNEFLQDAQIGRFDTVNELKDYLIDEAEHAAGYVNALDPLSLVDAYLKYNGIVGFTEDILNVVLRAYRLEEW